MGVAEMSNPNYRRVPIDFEVFKALVAEMRGPEDSFNDVIRRRLELPEPKAENDKSDR